MTYDKKMDVLTDRKIASWVRMNEPLKAADNRENPTMLPEKPEWRPNHDILRLLLIGYQGHS